MQLSISFPTQNSIHIFCFRLLYEIFTGGDFCYMRVNFCFVITLAIGVHASGAIIEELSDICFIIEVRLRISYAFRMDARRKFGYILGYSRKNFMNVFFFFMNDFFFLLPSFQFILQGNILTLLWGCLLQGER